MSSMSGLWTRAAHRISGTPNYGPLRLLSKTVHLMGNTHIRHYPLHRHHSLSGHTIIYRSFSTTPTRLSHPSLSSLSSTTSSSLSPQQSDSVLILGIETTCDDTALALLRVPTQALFKKNNNEPQGKSTAHAQPKLLLPDYIDIW